MNVTDLLLQSGVKPFDTVIVYCGIEENDVLLASLLEELKTFFAPGLLVMPSGSDGTNRSPNAVFDPGTTPSGAGRLSELFRCSDGVVRSRHPLGSLAALGEGSQWLMEGHERCISSFSPASPWWKLFQKGAKCIFIGCGLERSGMIAAAEEWSGAAVLSKRFLRCRIAGENGRNRRLRVKVHTRAHHRNYFKIEETFRDLGILSKSRWENHDVTVMDAAGAVDLLLRLLHRKVRFFAVRRKMKVLKIV